ncbi:MAG: glycosyltransferase family 39 protein [Chloroflexota bacterium]|nr:glycosyltransferase family 39 protein [Chloroflexota bacterium]
MSSLKMRALWIALLLLAAALRLPFPAWDGGVAVHPDERFLLSVAESTPLWGDPNVASPDFPYGSLPVYLARLWINTAPDADPLYVLRLFSGLVGVLLVALAGALGRLLLDEEGALWAALLLATAPFPIQQAHFFTVDPLGTALATGAILATMRRRTRWAALVAGLALACKISLAWVLLPVVGGIFFAGRHAAVPLLQQVAKLLLLALLAFALAAPWLLLRPMTAWRGPLIQAGMVAGRFDFPYTRQYAGTWPYFYPLAQLALWGLGPLGTVAGLWGVTTATAQWRRLSSRHRVAAFWTCLYFLATAGLYVKYPRYLLPLYPVWVVWAIYGVRQLRSAPWLAGVGHWLLLLPTLALGWAQFSVYQQPHPWEAASRWLYANLLPGEVVAVEEWDHPLPVPLLEYDPARYTQRFLPLFVEDTPEKLAALAAAAEESEVMVLASRRGYGTLTRQPTRYAGTVRWYQRILAAREVRVFARCPRLGPVALTDDPLREAGLPVVLPLAERCGTPYALRLPRLDESFRVYDAPVVFLLLRR